MLDSTKRDIYFITTVCYAISARRGQTGSFQPANIPSRSNNFDPFRILSEYFQYSAHGTLTAEKHALYWRWRHCGKKINLRQLLQRLIETVHYFVRNRLDASFTGFQEVYGGERQYSVSATCSGKDENDYVSTGNNSHPKRSQQQNTIYHKCSRAWHFYVKRKRRNFP